LSLVLREDDRGATANDPNAAVVASLRAADGGRGEMRGGEPAVQPNVGVGDATVALVYGGDPSSDGDAEMLICHRLTVLGLAFE
jgi:co-chaperonin GroES (HSP10)